jgi:ubiquinone/menaquinone biosynthesis C-methylase UbiE
MNIDKWHQRFLEQAKWTEEVRETLFKESLVAKNDRILEVGCGTGAILKNIQSQGYSYLYGIDIDLSSLKFAKQNLSTIQLINADAHFIPFLPNTFDVVYCHYLLLWAKSPKKVLNQMTRLLKSGGKLMIFAEPDYHCPQKISPQMAKIRELQVKSLIYQGANPQIGSSLFSFLKTTGLKNIFVDQLKSNEFNNQNLFSEIEMLRYDLSFISTENESSKLIEQFEKAYVKNEQYKVSTFYGIGFKD